MWNCCRTCLKENGLTDIFRIPHQHLEYCKVLKQCTGLEIKLKDSLPQQMCAECVTKINEIMEFRVNCFRAYKTLIDIVKNKQNTNNQDIKQRKDLTCKSFEDNNTDTSCTISDMTNEVCNNEQITEFEMSIEEMLNNPNEIVFQNSVNYEKVDLVYEDKKVKDDMDKTHQSEDIVCKYCHVKFSEKKTMYNHYKIHTGKSIVCEHCGTKFSTKRRLLVHCRAKHGYEKIDQCRFCEYKASSAESLKIHERTHTGEKPYVCAECGAAFHRRSCYLQHTPIHRTRKTVQCDECPSMFKSVTLMKIHKAKHKKRNLRLS